MVSATTFFVFYTVYLTGVSSIVQASAFLIFNEAFPYSAKKAVPFEKKGKNVPSFAPEWEF
ncbi:hypothetical protein B1222_16535 [Paenibacillus larvae subsp. pulvifaciens]|nr:hypothetical protein B1222_16535 [Paenibacillus larvae subsp. pulvifaciens]